MTTSAFSGTRAADLPPGLRTAQEAMDLPEVQEMLRRLSGYQLGIFMPHMHDEETGDFQSLADDLIQVESELEVSFRSSKEVSSESRRFLPVGWAWRAGGPTPVAACEMDEDKPGGAGQYVKHKMVRVD